MWATIDGILASFRQVVEEYFAALTTADPLVCQAHGAAAQRSLDEVAQIAGALGANLKAHADAEENFMRGLLLGALGGWPFGRRGH